MTYGELTKLIDRLQHSVNEIGFGRDDRIAIIGRSDAAMAALVTGIWNCATAVPMNPALSVEEFESYCRDLKVQAVAIFTDLDTAARDAAQRIGLPVLDVETTDPRISGLIDIRSSSGTGRAARPGRAQPEDQAVVLRTSGTTSHGKIVPATHREWLAKIIPNAKALELTPVDRCLNPMPLFYGHGLCTPLGASIFAGASLITAPEFSVEVFFHLLENLDPTWYTAS